MKKGTTKIQEISTTTKVGKVTFKDAHPYKLDVSTIKTIADIAIILREMNLAIDEKMYKNTPDIQKYFPLTTKDK